MKKKELRAEIERLEKGTKMPGDIDLMDFYHKTGLNSVSEMMAEIIHTRLESPGSDVKGGDILVADLRALAEVWDSHPQSQALLYRTAEHIEATG